MPCYYSIIERDGDGHFVGQIPDLPGLSAAGLTEDEVIKQLSQIARQRLHEMIMMALPFPEPSPITGHLDGKKERWCRPVLLIIE